MKKKLRKFMGSQVTSTKNIVAGYLMKAIGIFGNFHVLSLILCFFIKFLISL
jgi:hypothetical protein